MGSLFLRYFVGGENVEGGFSEDGGFAHNGGLGWSEVEFEDVDIFLNGPVAISMGHYLFTQATGDGAGEVSKVEFTFGYKRDPVGTPRIFIHHSSKPYSVSSSTEGNHITDNKEADFSLNKMCFKTHFIHIPAGLKYNTAIELFRKMRWEY